MIRKLIVASAVFIAAFALHAGTASLTVLPGTFTNLFSFTPNVGSATLKQIIVTAGTVSSNTLVTFVDCPTNQLTFTNAAYTNTIRYATNITTFWTNFYGVVQTNTPVGSNLVLITATNNLVTANTNLYPQRLSVSAAAGNTTIIQAATGTSEGVYFDNGIWVTNASSGNAIISIVY